MSDYDLRAELRNILDTTDMTDPAEITDKVISTIPTEDLASVLRLALLPYVQTFMGHERLRAFKFSGADHAETDAQRLIVGAGIDLDRGDGSHRRNETHVPGAASPRSWKRDLLRARIHVGDNERKMLADCTVEDITAAAIERVALSRQNAAWADRYRKLAHRMEQYHADTVADMPYDVVAAILRGDPA
jgi:hypothetical protein